MGHFSLYRDAQWTWSSTFSGRTGCYSSFRSLRNIKRDIMKTSSVKRNLEPEQPKSPPVPLESLEDIAWELWLLIELLAPVRRRLPNTASQKLVDYVKDRLIAKSVALAKWKKARPELFPDSPIGARDVLPGENWIFPDHRNLAEVIEAERNPATVLSKAS